ncbi:RsmD family RNA methyltransferase, partial [Prochlorococcus sp. AH-716-E13]|nr:RsmD family RNA methyltransferase [Prochlorococcus sp. AH-716-E13]
DFNKIKFDFIYLDPPYRASYHELVLNQIFNCNFTKKGTIVICEHSVGFNIKKNILWEIYDVRTYGQSKLTFLIQI